MIARLRGEIIIKQLDRAVIECGSVGYLFFASADFLSQLEEGREAVVYTYLVTREDSQTLYGFESWQVREAFGVLLGAQGVGPKVALAALGMFKPSELAAAVQNEDTALLSRIPGLGKKTAAKFVVSIGEKLRPYLQSASGAPGSVGASSQSAGNSNANSAQIIIALEQMGWKVAEAKEAVDYAAAQSEQAPAAELLRAALQYLGAKRV